MYIEYLLNSYDLPNDWEFNCTDVLLNFSGILLMFGGVVNASVQEWFEHTIEPKSPRMIRRIRRQFFKRKND